MLARGLLISTRYPIVSMLRPSSVRFYQNNQTHHEMRRSKEYIPFTLNNLWDNDGARKERIRVGRGNGSGKGKTCGKGHKGQKARSPNLHRGFEGGQAPLHLRIPKRGFNKDRFNRAKPLTKINLCDIAYAVEKKRIDPTQTITINDLYNAGVMKKCEFGVKLLARGAGKIKGLGLVLDLEVSDASEAAVEAVKELGGSVKAVYNTKQTLRRNLMPHKYHKKEVRTPMPPPKKVLKLEALKDKGLIVDYPTAPWFEEYKAQKIAEAEAVAKRKMTDGETLIPKIPMDRFEGVGLHNPRVEAKQIPKTVRYTKK